MDYQPSTYFLKIAFNMKATSPEGGQGHQCGSLQTEATTRDSMLLTLLGQCGQRLLCNGQQLTQRFKRDGLAAVYQRAAGRIIP